MSNDKVNKQLDRVGLVPEAFPLLTVGKSGQNAFIGEHKIRFSGPTGMVATSYGMPGVTVGRLATGVYGIRFPRWKEVSIDAQLYTPTGVEYISSVGGMTGVAEIVGVSGGAELRLGRAATGGAGVAPANAVTGMVVGLRFYVNPVTAY